MINAAGIILAAGRGKRMGAPKAGLIVDGVPAVVLAAQPMIDVGVDPIAVVCGAEAQKIQRLIDGRLTCVVNENWAQGQFSSLQTGLCRLPPNVWTFVLPVDVLDVHKETYEVLFESVKEKTEAIVPTYHGRRGHPVLLAPSFWNSLLTMPTATSRLDYLLRQAQLLEIEVNDPAILSNLNTPADLSTRVKKQK